MLMDDTFDNKKQNYSILFSSISWLRNTSGRKLCVWSRWRASLWEYIPLTTAVTVTIEELKPQIEVWVSCNLNFITVWLSTFYIAFKKIISDWDSFWSLCMIAETLCGWLSITELMLWSTSCYCLLFNNCVNTFQQMLRSCTNNTYIS